jgi:hypothetical protein
MWHAVPGPAEKEGQAARFGRIAEGSTLSDCLPACGTQAGQKGLNNSTWFVSQVYPPHFRRAGLTLTLSDWLNGFNYST